MKQFNFQKFLASEIQQTVDVSRNTEEVLWVVDRTVFKKKKKCKGVYGGAPTSHLSTLKPSDNSASCKIALFKEARQGSSPTGSSFLTHSSPIPLSKAAATF